MARRTAGNVNPRDPRERLQATAARLRRARVGALAVAASSVGLLSAIIATRVGLSASIGLIDATLVMVGGALVVRRRPITPAIVAAHLDRTVPEFEESAALLLTDDDSVLARLQRRRTITALARNDTLPPMPNAAARVALGIAVVAGLAALVVLAVPARSASRSDSAIRPIPAGALRRLVISGTALRWQPPAYTGRAARRSADLDATVEEGSAVSWDITALDAISAAVVTTAGDTVRASRRDDGHWHASTIIRRPTLWRAEVVRGDDTARTTDHLLVITPDQPPLLAIVAPPTRVAIEWREAHELVARALVSDDYGLGLVRLVATVASGRGEGVKFREVAFAIEVETRRGPASIFAARRIMLDSLAVAPGDEVLIAFEARDRRTPDAQVARSETIFLSILDTLDAPTATLPGMSLRVEPAYFRSQRQIILDTETLLRDMRASRGLDTIARATAIGFDQHLLRLRYGALVGEETEGMGEGNDPDPASDAPITAEDFRHDHDMAENATLLGASVKALLKRALGAMWESEKRLRIGDARNALPFEYRALEALEEIRRASRAYVKRIGFEPPAIEITSVRLTKLARGLASLDVTGQPLRDASEPALRAAITVLDRPVEASTRATIEAAGVRLAERIVEESPGRHLETLRALRGVLDGNCDACLAIARRGLLVALPDPPAPIRSVRPARGAIGGPTR